MSPIKPKLTFYDAHGLDRDYYHKALSSNFELIFSDDVLSSSTLPLAEGAALISVHVSSPVTAEFMKQLPKLRHVACRTTGYDNIDLEYANAHDITISTVPSYGEDTVAEYAFLLLLAISRRLMLSAHSVHAGAVSPEKLTGHDMNGKTLGIVGTGRIGRHAAGIGRGFGMTVVAYDPFPQVVAGKEIGYEYLSLDELLARSDFISLHAPATPETHHLLDAAAFSKLKPGVFIVNTARGTLIDTPALIDALRSGRVAGAGLDVLEGEEYLHIEPDIRLMEKENIDREFKRALSIDVLSKMPNVLITSHNAYNSAEALHRIRKTTASNIRSWHDGKPTNCIS